jgi:hypothetical protein
MKIEKVSIPKPCSYGWDKMTVTNDRKGRHCEACNKIVVDFTSMTTSEIQKNLATLSNVKTCGHFKTIDTNIDLIWYQRSLLKLHNYIDTNYHKTIFVGFILFSLTSVLSLTGCSTVTDGKVECQTKECRTADSIAYVEYIRADSIVKVKEKNSNSH